MKRYSKSDIVISAICLGFVVVLTAVLCALRATSVIPCDKNPYSMLFSDLVLGVGIYVLAFAIDKKWGIEFAIGSILIAVAGTLLAIRYEAHIAIIILVPIIILALAFAAFVTYKYLSLKSTKNNKE